MCLAFLFHVSLYKPPTNGKDCVIGLSAMTYMCQHLSDRNKPEENAEYAIISIRF